MDSSGTPATKPGLLERVASWASRRRRVVLVGWVVALVGAIAGSGAVGTNYANDFSLKGTESQRAVDLLKRDFPAQAGDIDQIVLHARAGKITDAAARARVAPMLASVARLPHVTGVASPYSTGSSRAVSPDGTIAFATVTFDQRANTLPKPAIKKVMSVARAAGSSRLQVELGGQAIEQANQTPLGFSTAVGLIAAMVVLLLTFGSALAMGLPILTALLGLGTAIGIAGIASQVVSLPNVSTELAAMIGLGVGIDYALFIVTRFRESYSHGADVDTAIGDSMATAGRAVLFAGATVIIALLGQFVLGVGFLNGMAMASALAVLLTMLASLTVLPALLSRFGARLGRKARERVTAAAGAPLGGPWARWSAFIGRHPWQGMIAGVSIMLALAAPALALRMGTSDAGNDPAGKTTRKAYDLLDQGFGRGFNGPLQIVASLPKANDRAALDSIAATLRTTADVASVSTPRLNADATTAVISVFPRSAPQAQASTDLVTTLRASTLPALERSTQSQLLVAGPHASQVDFTHVLSTKMPLFIGIVVLMSALLLLVVFRSVVIPVQAAVMNLLSIGASLGVVVAIFQWGWLGGLLNIQPGPIDSFIPVMLFAIVFGLSMDYEVFLISRIREEWTKRRDASAAVNHGLASSGRVITAAATIMICVFLSFFLGDDRSLKLFGLSLATGVFVDAFVVRSLLLPSVLHLLGRRTWEIPSWLDRRLPRVAVEQERERQALEPAFEHGG
ncbi:MAG: putative drug exporter of the superfamily [Solirubrobacteraceae bacterium]|nr:putative drug exporter of the superfamily [Solirubrobacteraceae bacterium]